MNSNHKTVSAILIIALVFLTGCFDRDKRIRLHEPLDTIATANGKILNLTVGLGSGAFHHKDDPQNIIYTITDRGPNMWSTQLPELFGVKSPEKEGLLFLTPRFAPTIYKLALIKDGYKVLDRKLIKNKHGLPVSGIPNPNTEKAYSVTGKEVFYDPEGLDTEALVRLKDGTFWIADEYAPSLLHVSQHGRILERFIPKGHLKTVAWAEFKTTDELPEIIHKRKPNRGIEALAISPDEQYLYFMLQSPLAHPDTETAKSSRNVRLYRFNLKDKKVDREYLYRTTKSEKYKGDYLSKNTPPAQKSVKISEMVALDHSTLIVLERVHKNTRLYRVSLTGSSNLLNSKWDAIDTSPALEELSKKQIENNHIIPVHKKLVFDSNKFKDLPAKIEGLAYLGGNKWVMINDNDFGTTGEETHLVKVELKD